MNGPHKHRECIIAWANGAKIEYRNGDEWVVWPSPVTPPFYENVDYRIKPDPKPTQEQVIAWAREAGAEITDWIDKCFGEDVFLFDKEQLKAAMSLAYEAGRKDERTKCAELCEIKANTKYFERPQTPMDCANAIRKRG